MEEDQILCNAWLEVSQNPIYGINKKKKINYGSVFMKFFFIIKSLIVVEHRSLFHVICHAL